MHLTKKEENWYVFYTKPRSERKALLDLSFRYNSCFLPVKEEIRQWRDRRKKIELPLFPSYIFVKIPASEIYYVISSGYIVKAIKFGNKFTFLKDKEINDIKKMMNFGSPIEVSNNLLVGDEVEILEGPLIGVKGVISRRKNQNRFVLNLTSIHQSLIVDIDSCRLKKVGNTKKLSLSVN